MILLQLYWEFFKTGLFAIGGGLATLPFLSHMGEATGWFTQAQLADMVAVSESTPGPIGINMATYVGFTTSGVPGAVIATLGLVTPSIIVILIIASFLKAFRTNGYVDTVFTCLRPASTALIAVAGIGLVLQTLVHPEFLSSGLASIFDWKAIALAAVLILLTRVVKPTKGLHPIIWIAASAAVGIIFAF